MISFTIYFFDQAKHISWRWIRWAACDKKTIKGMRLVEYIIEGLKGRCQKTGFIWDFVPNIRPHLPTAHVWDNALKHVIHKWGGHIWPFHDALRPQRL